MSACLAVERSLCVACPGGDDGMAAAAVNRHFGSAVKVEVLPNCDDALLALVEGSADYAICPEPESTDVISPNLLTEGLSACGMAATDKGYYLVMGKQQTRPTGSDQVALLASEDSGAGEQHLPRRAELAGLKVVRSCRCSFGGRDCTYLVAAGHVLDPPTGTALNTLVNDVPDLHVIGSFPTPVRDL